MRLSWIVKGFGIRGRDEKEGEEDEVEGKKP